MTYRCLFRDKNGVQCRATSENPHNDGWVNIDTPRAWRMRSTAPRTLRRGRSRYISIRMKNWRPG